MQTISVIYFEPIEFHFHSTQTHSISSVRKLYECGELFFFFCSFFSPLNTCDWRVNIQIGWLMFILTQSIFSLKSYFQRLLNYSIAAHNNFECDLDNSSVTNNCVYFVTANKLALIWHIHTHTTANKKPIVSEYSEKWGKWYIWKCFIYFFFFLVVAHF